MAKTHKPDCPFRVVVTERGSWQRTVAGFLQKQLSLLTVGDPYVMRSSVEVTNYLKDDNPNTCRAFSVDVEDLFYSVPIKDLLVAVNNCIEATGEVEFRNSSGVSNESFLELLSFYLKSMLVGWEGGIFVQRNGSCIGSCVDPVLSDIFLGQLEVSLEGLLQNEGVKRVFIYVDDFLIFVDDVDRTNAIERMMSIFSDMGKGLSFTFETPSDGRLQFLDLSPYLM